MIYGCTSIRSHFTRKNEPDENKIRWWKQTFKFAMSGEVREKGNEAKECEITDIIHISKKKN